MSHDTVLIFKITGANEFAADVGNLTLSVDGKQIMQSTAFSGGASRTPTQIRFRQAPITSGPTSGRCTRTRSQDRPNGQNTLFFGIEKIEESGWHWEWGRLRARLNESGQGLPQAYRGNFLHGKDRPGDWTHGCICERSERILNYLWNTAPGKVEVRVER